MPFVILFVKDEAVVADDVQRRIPQETLLQLLKVIVLSLDRFLRHLD